MTVISLIAMISLVVGLIAYSLVDVAYNGTKSKAIGRIILTVIVTAMSLLVYSLATGIYTNHHHDEVVKQCKSQMRSPKAAEDLTDKFCEKWAK